MDHINGMTGGPSPRLVWGDLDGYYHGMGIPPSFAHFQRKDEQTVVLVFEQGRY